MSSRKGKSKQARAAASPAPDRAAPAPAGVGELRPVDSITAADIKKHYQDMQARFFRAHKKRTRLDHNVRAAEQQIHQLDMEIQTILEMTMEIKPGMADDFPVISDSEGGGDATEPSTPVSEEAAVYTPGAATKGTRQAS